MSKLLLTLVATGLMLAGYSQNGNNICVFNSIQNYLSGGGPTELERGMKCSDEAAVNESTINDSKTWNYRGMLYTYAFIDTTLRKKDVGVGLEAVKAFKKLADINNPKFKDWDDVYRLCAPLNANLFNVGIEQFNAKNYGMAYKLWYSLKDLDAVYKYKNEKSPVDLPAAFKNAAIAAEDMGDKDAAIAIYKDWIEIQPSAIAYYQYAVDLKKQGKTDEASKIVDQGLAKFPNDANILAEKLNGFIAANDMAGALSYINKFLEVEPNNDAVLFLKGQAFDKIGNADSVLYYYNKAIDVNPKNSDALNNVGAYYVNKANEITEQINKLGNTSADTKKYEELKKQQQALFMQAKPYIQKAHDLKPDDANISRNLKIIELKTAQ